MKYKRPIPKLSPAEVVIDHFGVRPLARMLGVSASAPCQWRKRSGHIPSEFYEKIIAESDGEITADDLVFGRELS